MLAHLDGRFLVTFLTVLEEGSFSRAAKKLGYVQSTVTSQIQLLEQGCGHKLFIRFPRGVQPTEAGEMLAVYARQFVKLGKSLEEAFVSMEQPRGTVRVRALESFCVTRLTGFLGPFFTEYRDVLLKLETGFQSDIVEQVASHSADFGIVPKNPLREDIVFEPLVEENMVLAASKNLAERIYVKGWNHLSGTQVIGFGNRCIYQTDGHTLLTQLGMPTETQMVEFPSTELIRYTVASGLGIAFVPEVTMKRELSEGTVVCLPLPKQITLTHGLIRHRDHVLNTPSKVFRDKLLAHFPLRPISLSV